MRLRRRYVPLAILLGLATAGLPAIASSETSPTVEAVNTKTGSGFYTEEHHAWSPTQVAVMAGGVVRFSNPTEIPHGVRWVSGPTPKCDSTVPVGTEPAVSGTKWSGSCTFTEAGTYTFYCTVHGPEMTGTVTVSSNGTTTTTTPTATTTTTTTTPTTPVGPPSGSPLVGSPALRSSQRAGSLKGSLDISKAGAGDRLEIDVFAKSASLAKANHSTRVRVGRLIRSSVSAGRVPFSVKLDLKARRALKRRRRLALTVKITLTPFYGEAFTVTRSVVEHG